MKNQVIAITGGASGIGLSLAKLLLAQGARISIADASQANLTKASEELKDAHEQLLFHQCDVRNLDQVQDWLKQTVDRFGRIDKAANLAGVTSKHDAYDMIETLNEEDWDFVIGVNLTGIMHCMKEELKLMKPDSGCNIVNAASVAGLSGYPGAGPYCASKHGVIGLTRTVAKEVAHKGIRINCVAPGAVDTPLLANAEQAVGVELAESRRQMLPIPRKADPIEVAKVFEFLLSDAATFVTGSTWTVDGGYTC